MKDVFRSLNLQTIKGRTLLLVCFFLSILTALAFVVILKNNSTRNISNEILATRMPTSHTISKISQGLHDAQSTQLFYIVTGNATLKEKRAQIWDKQIIPAYNDLRTIDPKIVEVKKAEMDSLVALLIQLRTVQEEVDRMTAEHFLSKEKLLYLSEGEEGHLQTAEALSESLIFGEDEFQAQISAVIQQKLSPVQILIHDVANRLSQYGDEATVVSVSKIDENIESVRSIIFLMLAGAFLLSILFTHSVVQTLKKSIQKPTDMLERLALGELPEEQVVIKDELKPVADAGNQLKENLRKASEFANSIGEGRFDQPYQPASERDILGNALLQMKEKLLQIAEEDRKRKWMTEGLAKFAELVRMNNTADFEKFGDSIVSALVKYLDANQGGMFILNDDIPESKYLELISCYAYNKKKYVTRRLNIYKKYAEGLVGQAYMEKGTIHLTNIPENYIEITSGLGEATPAHLMIVPLKVNNMVQGVIELASFSVFQPYQIEFVEKVGESLASALINVKNNDRTKRLLEATQEQAEEMRAQEEEMRQNMEELAATQEEMRRKGTEMEKLLTDAKSKEQSFVEVQQALERQKAQYEAIVNSNHDHIFAVNKAYKVVLMNKSTQQSFRAMGYDVRVGIDILEMTKPSERDILKAEIAEAFLGKVIQSEKQYFIDGKIHVYHQTFFPIANERGEIIAVGGSSRNITELKKAQVTMQQAHDKRKLLSKNIPGVMYELAMGLSDGKIGFIYVSERFDQYFDISKDVAVGMKDGVHDLPIQVHPEDMGAFARALEVSAKEMTDFSWKGRLKGSGQPEAAFAYYQMRSAPILMEDQQIHWHGIIMEAEGVSAPR